MSRAPRVTTPPAPTRLAFAPSPLDDEPLDGYLEYVAHNLGRTPASIHRLLGMPNKRPYSIVRHLEPTAANCLSTALDLAPKALQSMTLQRYDHLGLMPSFEKRGHGTGTWPRGSGARYCPDCLRERGLRWKLSWYLQWTFACTRHEQLLSHTCPRCRQPVRTRTRGHPIRNHAAPTPPRAICACSTTDLAHRTQDGGPLPTSILLAQELISGVLDGATDSVVAFGEERSRTEWVYDLASLTRLLMTHLPAEGVPAQYADILSASHMSDRLSALSDCRMELASSRSGPVGPSRVTDPDVADVLASWGTQLGLTQTRSAGVRLRDATQSSRAIALTASSAAIVLTSPNIAAASELLQVLPVKVRLQAVSESTRRGLSWPLIQALDVPSSAPRGRSARARVMRVQACRFRADGSNRPPLDPAKIPSRIWDTVSLLHPTQIGSGYVAVAASVALLSLGTRVSTRQACERLGVGHLGSMVESELTQVLGLASGRHEDGDAELLNNLLLLHDELTANAVPIDYVRRRRTFTSPVPPAERTARRIARALDKRPTLRLRRFMGWWIFELLTGSDVLLSPHHLSVHASHRLAYRRQRSEWEANPPSALLRRAEHALLRNRLDEPLTWAPVVGLDGRWRCPAPTIVRQLDWSNRDGRATGRPAGGEAALGLQDAVNFAASRQSLKATRLAEKLARFSTVARAGAITAAARQMGMSQSVLSASMTRLELELGMSLIDRTRRGSSLTREGRQLHRLIQASTLAHQALGFALAERSTEEGIRSHG